MTEEVVKYKKIIRDENGNVLDVIEGEVTYKFPSSIQEAVELHGEDVVLSIYNAALEVKVQNICRSADSVEEAQEAVNKYVPGVSRRSATGSKKNIMAIIQSLSPEKRNEILELLKNLK